MLYVNQLFWQNISRDIKTSKHFVFCSLMIVFSMGPAPLGDFSDLIIIIVVIFFFLGSSEADGKTKQSGGSTEEGPESCRDSNKPQ